ncbi:lipase [soil metagenome]
MGTAAVVAAGVIAAVVVAARPPAARREVVPVVLVPGYLGTAAQMSELGRALRRAGREVVPVTLPGRGTGDMTASAQGLARAVEATGAARVDLVGFSAGGIVVRTFLSELDGTERTRRVVLLGAPNHGAEVAELATSVDPGLCTGACAQIAPGSSFLERLNRDETPDGSDYTTVWTDRDTTVTPPASALLEGATNIRVQDVCGGATTSHGDLVRDPVALGLTVLALAGDLDRVPEGRRCALAHSVGAGAEP